MNAPSQTNTKVTATNAALVQIAAILAKDDGKNSALRISVEGGGCSGFSYNFDLVDKIEADDFVIEGQNGKLVIDEISMVYMAGSQVDFVDDLMGQSFQVNNPNAVASCGCGTSFSI